MPWPLQTKSRRPQLRRLPFSSHDRETLPNPRATRQPGSAPMNGRRSRTLLLWIAATDATFDRIALRGQPALCGKCIHCGSRHTILLDGTPVSDATIEHIVPRNHGGTDDLENLAIACARCNGEKGIRHDARPRLDEKLQALIAQLQGRRRERLREPPEGLPLPTLRPVEPEPAAGRRARRR
jgi:5-methylcytosine-specific restriction endonuclease McrA